MQRITEIENHHLANTRAIIVAGKSHQWTLKLVHKSIMRNRNLYSSEYLPKNTYYKKKNSNLTTGKAGRYHLKQVIKIIITRNETYQHHVPPETMNWERPTSLSSRAFYKITGQYSKCIKDMHKKQTEELSQIEGAQGDMTTKRSVGSWVWSWASKRTVQKLVK